MRTKLQEKQAAQFLLQDRGISLSQCVRLVLDALDMLPEEVQDQKPAHVLRDCLRLGVTAWTSRQGSVTYAEAVERLLVIKSGRSARTRQDIRQCLRRLGKGAQGWDRRLLSTITREECARRLEQVFPQPTRRTKARAVLSVLFNEGIRRDWCRENPVKHIEIPRIREQEIRALELGEIARLLDVAARYHDGSCLAAVGLMLYAGVRPRETERLHWRDVDLDEGEVIVPPEHSKTGGGRHIPICPALHAILRSRSTLGPDSSICPANWLNKWRELRREAGFGQWQQDALRHTFASYFAKSYRDLNALQLFMGHSNPHLLRTRYVNMRGIRAEDAHRFWHGGPPPPGESGDWYRRG